MHRAATIVGNGKASIAQPWPLGLKNAFQLADDGVRFPKSAALQSTPDTAQPRSMRSLSADLLGDAAKCAGGLR